MKKIGKENWRYENLDKAASQICEEREKRRAKQQAQKIELRQWKEKELHLKDPERMGEASAYDCKTNQRFRSTELRAEIEGLITTAQDQNLPTKTY